VTDFPLLCDARIASVPVVECWEPLVDLRRITEIAVDGRQADIAGAYAHSRSGVAERLTMAGRLLPTGWRLAVVEAYRPADLQQRYFDEYIDFLVSHHPAWSWDELRAHASRYISPPEVAPHTSGAAVDVMVIAGGEPVWMGTDVNVSPEESDGACYTAAGHISPQARRNRIALHRAMSAAGFINYPTEWWHWSYGDRYWAYAVRASAARYGPISINGSKTNVDTGDANRHTDWR
jgi:D-alanyl-D-alanine dipeptidase